jgi:hypothetical protein
MPRGTARTRWLHTQTRAKIPAHRSGRRQHFARRKKPWRGGLVAPLQKNAQPLHAAVKAGLDAASPGRAALGWSQSSLNPLAGLPQSYLTFIVSDTRSLRHSSTPRGATIERRGGVLGAPFYSARPSLVPTLGRIPAPSCNRKVGIAQRRTLVGALSSRG